MQSLSRSYYRLCIIGDCHISLRLFSVPSRRCACRNVRSFERICTFAGTEFELSRLATVLWTNSRHKIHGTSEGLKKELSPLYVIRRTYSMLVFQVWVKFQISLLHCGSQFYLFSETHFFLSTFFVFFIAYCWFSFGRSWRFFAGRSPLHQLFHRAF